MSDGDLNDRVKTLNDISGLDVRHRRENGESIFEFFLNGKNVKTAFTYAKAKLFAEGVAFGKMLTPWAPAL